MGSRYAVLMARVRARRKEKGLTAVTVYVRPEDRYRLKLYVEDRLYGEYPTPRKKTDRF